MAIASRFSLEGKVVSIPDRVIGGIVRRRSLQKTPVLTTAAVKRLVTVPMLEASKTIVQLPRPGDSMKLDRLEESITVLVDNVADGQRTSISHFTYPTPHVALTLRTHIHEIQDGDRVTVDSMHVQHAYGSAPKDWTRIQPDVDLRGSALPTLELLTLDLKRQLERQAQLAPFRYVAPRRIASDVRMDSHELTRDDCDLFESVAPTGQRFRVWVERKTGLVREAVIEKPPAPFVGALDVDGRPLTAENRPNGGTKERFSFYDVEPFPLPSIQPEQENHLAPEEFYERAITRQRNFSIPSIRTIDDGETVALEITNGKVLAAIRTIVPDAWATVAIVPRHLGFKEETHITALRQAFKKAGIETIVWDPVGLGGSEGTVRADYRPQRLIDSTRDALVVVKNRFAQGKPFGVVGHSMGGLLAGMAAAQLDQLQEPNERPYVHAITMICSMLKLTQEEWRFAAERYAALKAMPFRDKNGKVHMMPLSFFNEIDVLNLEPYIRELRMPVQLIAGGMDNVVPPSVTADLARFAHENRLTSFQWNYIPELRHLVYDDEAAMHATVDATVDHVAKTLSRVERTAEWQPDRFSDEIIRTANAVNLIDVRRGAATPSRQLEVPIVAAAD